MPHLPPLILDLLKRKHDESKKDNYSSVVDASEKIEKSKLRPKASKPNNIKKSVAASVEKDFDVWLSEKAGK